MPTDAQRRNLASAHHAEVQDLNERISLLEQQLAEAKRQMESQKDEWLAWDAKRAALELDAARYRQLAKGEPLTVVVPTPTDEKPNRKVTIIYGPNSEPGYAEALGKAIDAAIASTQEQI
ncbi:MAG: hypothetical protein WC829_03150 [Hyphomicrobium sp.]|jgi:hypothetical protein